MKAALFSILAALTAFLVVVFILNLRHGGVDIYYGGSLTHIVSDPVDDSALARMIPSEMKHSCPTCGECVHPIRIVRNERILRITARHRWWQLFNARDRNYYFDDLVQFAGNFKNPSAQDAEGGWLIVGVVEPARHGPGPAHECGTITSKFTARYTLITEEAPIGERHNDYAAPVDVLDRVEALVYRYQNPSRTQTIVLHFGWEMGVSHGHGLTESAPCPCGKP